MNFCTVVAKNYIAHARVLARSIAQHHPEGRLWTLIVDDFAGYIDPASEPFEVLTPADIRCEPFTQMAVHYTVLELSTAVKPWFLRHLMSATGAPVTYLDPDIKLYGPLSRLDELALRHGMVLIPHNTQAIPPDGRVPTQLEVMKSGVFNLGYASVASRTDVERFLDWWGARLLHDCRIDTASGYFLDQRWFDLVPAMLDDYAVVRDPEYNVAYWNLGSRSLTHDGERYLVDEQPLAFFHFSGFNPEHPLLLSRYQDRVAVAGNPPLERLLAEYATELVDQGYFTNRNWPYTYAVWADGTQPDDMTRALYDCFVDEMGSGAPSPFTRNGIASFMNWLGTPPPGAPPGVNRVLAQIYASRADLKQSYPDLAGTDGPRLVSWAQDSGTAQYPLLARVMATTGLQAPVGRLTSQSDGLQDGHAYAAPWRQAPWGANVVGYFRSELGVGEVARQIVGALDAKDIPVLPIHGQTIPLSRQGHSYLTATPDDAPFPVNIICMNADMLPGFAEQLGEDFFVGRYSIGLWFWEVSSFPERWRSSFELVEEVWAPTAHIAAALKPVAPVPVETIRVPVEPLPTRAISRVELGLPEDGFAFLFGFDYLSVFKRKNPLAVIDAFARAFAPGEGARLVIKCINSDHDPANHAELLAAAALHRDVRVLDRYMSAEENNGLTRACDCYVSLHRAEGFGLGMAEAMYYGKPVIATGYSGNLDFMTPSNGMLVDHELVPIGSGAEPYPAEGTWAAPQVDHAAALMRQVFDDQSAARDLGARAALDIRRSHSAQAAGDILYRRLERLRTVGRTRRAGDPTRRRRPSAEWLAQRVEQGPAHADDAGPSARALARRAVLRVMAPFTAYQEAVNSGVIAALDEMGADIAALRSAAGLERAQWMAETRRSHRQASVGRTTPANDTVERHAPARGGEGLRPGG